MLNYKRFITTLISIIIMSGCATTEEPYDYSALKNEAPKSILVLPPLNNTIEVNAPYTYISTVTRPLAEKGYYVFPVAVIDAFLKENGLPTPAEMNSIGLDKIDEIIGADAVLYVELNEWGQKYQVLSSVTVVSGHAKLVSVKTGQLLWEAPINARQDPNGGNNNGLVGALVGALVSQIMGELTDSTLPVSRMANNIAIGSKNRGLLNGPYKIEKK